MSAADVSGEPATGLSTVMTATPVDRLQHRPSPHVRDGSQVGPPNRVDINAYIAILGCWSETHSADPAMALLSH